MKRTNCKMSVYITLCIFYISISCTTAIPVNTRQSDEKLPFTFDDIFPSRFSFRGFNGSWISDDQFLFRSGDLNTYRITDGNVELFLEASVFSKWTSPSYTYSADYTKLLVRYDVTSVFRHSIVARYDIYFISSGLTTNIGNQELLNFCVWSPNGQEVAFVYKNNVFIHRASGEEAQLTEDGVDGVIYNGVPDWVYEEEVLGSGGALWFSPNGNKIAIASFDDTDVEEFTYILYEDHYEKEVALRYPKPGRVNPTVTFRYIDLTDNTNTWHSFAAPIEKVNEDHILYSVNWITDDLVGAFWLNRRQNLGSYQICSTSGNGNCYEKRELLSWEENTVNRERLNDYERPTVHFENVPVADGFKAAVKLTLPSEIDLNASTQKYPMVVEVYGGPNSVRVTNSFSLGFKDYQVTSEKIIHCQIDGRGSGNKGKYLLFTMNDRMGTVEIEDQIAVTKYLQQKYRFIDATRTGIWGWSYGGYATAMALSTDTEHIFKCGVSVAPVSAWIYYDSIYTERYMGLPTDDDNIRNYNATDVTQHIGELKTHQLLLMHGNSDDNVHFQQSMVLTKALVQADVQFEQASYSNEAHGLSGVTRHVYHTIDKFWINCFNLGS